MQMTSYSDHENVAHSDLRAQSAFLHHIIDPLFIIFSQRGDFIGWFEITCPTQLSP